MSLIFLAGTPSQAVSITRGESRKRRETGRANGIDSIMDDRKGDWLARQLKEEAALERLGKYDLGAAHSVSCDARKLKLSHRHDDTIDNGEL